MRTGQADLVVAICAVCRDADSKYFLCQTDTWRVPMALFHFNKGDSDDANEIPGYSSPVTPHLVDGTSDRASVSTTA